MTIAAIALSEAQRQQLLDILNRRFRKTSDAALLELERLTRHPADLTGFQAKSRDLVAVRTPPVKDPPKNDTHDVIDILPGRPVTRREFFAYSATGVLGLMLLGTGYGWSSSNEKVDALSDEVASLNVEIDDLMSVTSQIQAAADTVREDILRYQNIYLQTQNHIALFKEGFERTRALYNQIGQTGMTIAETIEFIINLLSFNPLTQKYAQPVSTILDILKITPDNLSQAEATLSDLDLWFSSDQFQDINNNVLSPVQSIFDAIDNEIKARIQSIQASHSDL